MDNLNYFEELKRLFDLQSLRLQYEIAFIKGKTRIRELTQEIETLELDIELMKISSTYKGDE